MSPVIIQEISVRFKRFLFSYDWGVIELQGALFKILWGIWALQPFPIFRTIEGFSSFATENQWGWFMIIFGTLHVVAVFSHQLIYRRIMTFMAFSFWVFVVVLIYQQSHTSSLVPYFFTIALFMGLNFLRLGLDTQFIASRRGASSNRGYDK